MKYSCEVVRDLIPLYLDDVASASSRRVVEAHLAECDGCRALLRQMRNEELEQAIAGEREDVIAGQRRFFQRRSAVIGSVVAGVFMIPILVCLIVNLASGAGLSWFFLVLAALLVAASLSVVPLMAPEDKRLWTLGSFTLSLLLLFGVCCLYTGGSWFFVASTSVLFGLSLIFLPFAVKSRALSERLGERRGLAVMAADTALFAVMMLAIGLHVGAPGFFRVAVPIALPLVLLAWALFFLIRNGKKAGAKQGTMETTASPLPPEPPGNIKLTGRGAGPKRRLPVWEIVPLALGSPIWLALLIVGFAVAVSVYVVVWAVILSLWAAEAALAIGSLGGVVMGVWAFCRGDGLRGLVTLCAAAVLAGLSIFLFFSCKATTEGTARLTKKLALWIKALF